MHFRENLEASNDEVILAAHDCATYIPGKKIGDEIFGSAFQRNSSASKLKERICQERAHEMIFREKKAQDEIFLTQIRDFFTTQRRSNSNSIMIFRLGVLLLFPPPTNTKKLFVM